MGLFCLQLTALVALSPVGELFILNMRFITLPVSRSYVNAMVRGGPLTACRTAASAAAPASAPRALRRGRPPWRLAPLKQGFGGMRVAEAIHAKLGIASGEARSSGKRAAFLAFRRGAFSSKQVYATQRAVLAAADHAQHVTSPKNARLLWRDAVGRPR